MFEVSLLIFLVLLIRKIFLGRVSSLILYALWGLVLVRLVIPVSPVSSISFWNAVDVVQEALTEEPGEKRTSVEESERYIETAQSHDRTGQDEKEDGIRKAENDLTVSAQPDAAASVVSASAGVGTRQIVWMIWCCVACLLFGLIVVINVRLSWHLIRNRELLGVRGKVKIYRTAYLKKPCLYGLFKPAIYLPERLNLSEEEKEQIILHEVVHYRHRDPLWSAVRVVVLSIYWFNPFVWLAVIYSRKDAEFACDESVIREIGEENRFFYGKVLLKLAGAMDKKEFLYVTAQMSNRGREMEKRIRVISGKKKYAKWMVVPFFLLCLLIIGITSGKTEVKKQEKSTETIQKKETVLSSPLQSYDTFLKETAGEKQSRYYSLAALGDQKEIVLLVSEKVQEISNYNYGSCGTCRIYGLVDGKITLCGEISAGEQDEKKWFLFLDNRLVRTESDSITKIGREKNSDQIVTEKRTLNRKDKKTFSAYIEWENEIKYGGIEALIFYQNPYTKETSESGPQKLSLKTSDEYYVKQAYVESYNIVLDLTQDGVEDSIEVALDKVKNPKDGEMFTVSLISGKTDKVLWGLPVNTVHAGWYGVYMYEEKGKKYLMVYKPAMYQGLADFSYKIFSVDEDGKEQVLHSDQLQFDLNHLKETDPVSFEKFTEGLNRYLRKAELIVSTLEGNVLTDEDEPVDLTYDPTEILQQMKQSGQ